MKNNYLLILACNVLLLTGNDAIAQQSAGQEESRKVQSNPPAGFPDVNKLSPDEYKRAVAQWAKDHPEEYKKLMNVHPSVTPEQLEKNRQIKNNRNPGTLPDSMKN